MSVLAATPKTSVACIVDAAVKSASAKQNSAPLFCMLVRTYFDPIRVA